MRVTVRNLVLLLFISVKASPMWGFSISDKASRVQSYLKRAQQANLWKDPRWLALGHYEKTFLNYKSPFTIGFFLNKNGDVSPEDELLTTIELLYGDNNQKLQCRYLARAKWLNFALEVAPEDRLPCENIQAWKKQLNAKGVSVIFAASDMGNASSSFGHTFLKIVNPNNANNKDLVDYGINYAANANINEGIFYAIKGLLGFYDGQFTMLPYHQKIREYINLEGRDIWEYSLNFTPEETDYLIDHLLEIENARAPYYFFSDNCSYQILKTLEVVRPELKLSDNFKYFVIPIDTIKKLIQLSPPVVIQSKYKKSLKTDYLESYAHLNFLQKKALDDAVKELAITDDYTLSKLDKAQVYETAMKFYSLKAFTTGNDYDNQKYELFLKRAAMGVVDIDDQNVKSEPPEVSHDSSALYFGVGQTDNLNSTTSFTSIKFRPALHDLEQQDFGTVAFSQNEMASIETRYFSYNGKTNNFCITKFTILNLINLNPVTQLDKNFSWKFRNEITRDENDLDANIFYPDIEASGGFSYDLALFNRSRIGYFATTRYWDNKIISLGPEILLVSRLTPKIGFSFDVTYFAQVNLADFLQYKAKLNYSLRKNYDLQIIANRTLNDKMTYQAQLVWNFIL